MLEKLKRHVIHHKDAINSIAAVLPTFFGGSADLSHSNMTFIKGEGLQDNENRVARNVQFGVREFGMATILKRINVTRWSSCILEVHSLYFLIT